MSDKLIEDRIIDCRKQGSNTVEKLLSGDRLTVYTLMFKKDNGELKVVDMDLNKESLYKTAALLEKEEEYKDGKFIIACGG